MTTQFLVDRRQPLLAKADFSSRGSLRRAKLAEVAGGTAADCTAVCCCPCSLVNLLVLALYKLPAELFRKVMRKRRRRRLLKAGAMQPRKCSYEEKDLGNHGVNSMITVVDGKIELKEQNKELTMELDKVMFDKFHDGGFWRSSSQSREIEL